MRNFVVTLPAVGGVYTVTEKFQKGHFSTYAGPSPASCDTGPGDTIKAGVTGKFSGTFTMSVVGPVRFNPNGSCDMTHVRRLDAVRHRRLGHRVLRRRRDLQRRPVPLRVPRGGQGLDYHDWTNADTGNIGDIGNLRREVVRPQRIAPSGGGAARRS